MIEKIGHIKNPLSIIAIFAGIAEISGTVILPFIHADNQSRYIWFLMLFPTALVGVFFITLWTNPKVLYAPSDYTDESNFIKMMEPATAFEVEAKARSEAAELETGTAATTLGPPVVPDATPPVPTVTETGDAIASQAARLRLYSQNEDRALSLLASEFPTLRRNVALTTKTGRRHVFDGIAEIADTFTIFEIKVTQQINERYIYNNATKFASQVQSFLADDPHIKRLIMVVVLAGETASANLTDLREVYAHGLVVEVRLVR